MNNYIKVKGARENNLKDITVEIPRDKLVVITGLSGSGKSSLAFDTIFAEGHRRFVESLSSYARTFLGQLDKPDVDFIEGLSPAIAIDQKTTSKNPRSTVGTITEIYDYLRLLYARVGTPHCPVCGKEIIMRTTDSIIDEILSLEAGTKFIVMAPVVKAKKGMHEKVLEAAKKSGYARVRIDGSIYELTENIELDKNLKHTIEVVIDRLIIKQDLRMRLADSVETALKLADGCIKILVMPKDSEEYELDYNRNYACMEHGISFPELSPRMFSFNNPLGACDECSGLGEKRVFSPYRMIPDMTKSLRESAIQVNGFKSVSEKTWNGPLFMLLGKDYGFTIDTPLNQLSQEAFNALFYGCDKTYEFSSEFDNDKRLRKVKYDGIVSMIEQRCKMGFGTPEYYDQFIDSIPCPKCKGKRLKKELLCVTVGGKSIAEFCDMPISEEIEFINSLKLDLTSELIAKDIISELKSRLNFLFSVGLEYLTLSRKASTLSGGESQRIRLATQIGSALMGVIYILDEPSIGLHQRDNQKLIATLKKLRDTGNSLLVVEHDEETMLESDYIIDIGPGAGINGGEVVACGTPEEVMKSEKSITGAFLSGRRKIAVPETRRKGNGSFIEIKGASLNNLKNIDVKIPLAALTCITGVSGSGKSSLINGTLYPVLASQLNGAHTFPGKYKEIKGIESLDKVIAIDQSPIGRTPRSNPATYTGVFTDIRELFAATPDAKKRAYTAGRFSFNIKGGRCEACEGDGVKCIEMHFLPDVYVTCPVCHGKRYNTDTLECRYKNKNISDVLEMSVDEAVVFFENHPKILRKISTLQDVGLGYIKLGQSATTLSGGEAQRVKLATELSKRETGKTVYILDEPTTGLHSADVEKLISILDRLVIGGNTVIVIEHNLDIIKTADYIIDLGPEGGNRGGTVIGCGTPEELSQNGSSYTGQFLKKILKNNA